MIAKKNSDMNSIMENIQQGIFLLDERLVVLPNYSLYLERIFGGQLAGKPLTELLEYLGIMDDQQAVVQQILSCCINEQEFTFKLNRKSLPKVVGVNRNYFELSWDVQIENRVVSKFIVTIKDVSQLKKLESESLARQRDVSKLITLMDISAQRFDSFIRDSLEIVGENLAMIMFQNTYNWKLIEMLYFNIVKTFLKDKEYRDLLLTTLVVLFSGTTVYHYLEGWSWIDSLYFSIITLTTIGYGDFSPQTDAGKLFTIFYILIGIGIILTFIDTVYNHYNDLKSQARSKKMKSRYEK